MGTSWHPCFGLPVTSAIGFRDRVDPLLACFLACSDPQIHLWCDTWWVHGGFHDSPAFLIHVLANHESITIGRGFEPTAIHAASQHCKSFDHSSSALKWFSGCIYYPANNEGTNQMVKKARCTELGGHSHLSTCNSWLRHDLSSWSSGGIHLGLCGDELICKLNLRPRTV